MLPYEDRRGARRLLREEAVRVKILASPRHPEVAGQVIDCSTVDMSATGLRLLLEAAVEPASYLELEVEMTEPDEHILLCGEVMWSRETEAQGYFLIGVMLVDGLQLARWQQLFI